MATEQATYQILAKEGLFELRLYEPMVLVTSPETDLAGGDGFSRLFNYIGGNNRKSDIISMTAPVINYEEDQQSKIAFVMPLKYRLKDVPQPNDTTLKIRDYEERQLAVITFSGKTSSAIISQKKLELQEWLRKKQMVPTGEMALARYNPPYVPYFMRRNELMVEIRK